MQLTSSQKKAIKYHEGPLLIIAGAGTGKTTVLVEKINYLIKKKLALPHEILALTFTEKASHEMEERVDRLLPYGYFQMWIMTFHSFCDDILRQESVDIGISPIYKLYTQAESLVFFKKNLFRFSLDYFRPVGNPYKFLDGLLQHFSRLRDEDISPDEYSRWAQNKKKKQELSSEEETEHEKNLELANAYKKYQELKREENVMDFGDLIFYTLQLFRKRKNILSRYKEKFKYILVDEFQDTNVAQYELIKLLAPPDENPYVTLVGDDSQSIYKFRGAAISNILQFMNEYKNAEKIVLLDNFRSNQTILDSAYRLIKHNDPDTLEAKLHISKNLKSKTGQGDKESINFHLTNRGEKEADFVGREILKLHDGAYKWSDIALLVRANSHADIFARTFNHLNIPYQFLGQGMLFKQPEIKELIAYLTFLTNITDSTALYRVITMDIFGIDSVDLALLVAFAQKTNRSFFESIMIHLSFFYKELARPEYEHLREFLFIIKESTRQKLLNMYTMITRHLAHINLQSVGQILYDFLDTTGILKNLSIVKNEREEKKALSIACFFDEIKTFEGSHEDASIFAFVEFITLSIEFKESPKTTIADWTEQNAVNILSVHASKGLEFPVVFLVNMVSERFPTKIRRELFPIPDALIKEILPEGDYHIEEERRLFYVGITRAQDKVYFTASRHYTESKRQKKISPFVYESVGKEIIENKALQKEDEHRQLSLFEYEKSSHIVTSHHIPQQVQFSFSQLETYKTCPLRYKYQYSIKIPIPKNSASSFGESVHRTLHKLYSMVKEKQHPTSEDLIKLYDTSWIPLGYESTQHEQHTKEKGRIMLDTYYKTYYQNNTHIIDLEKRFKIKIAPDLSIVGKIDRVDMRIDGMLEIVDYKTGKKPSDKELQKNIQLTLYALAASDQGLYKRKIEDIVLTFYFLQTNETISLQKTEANLVEVKKTIEKSAHEINKGIFSPKVGPWCHYCPFKINCEAWQ
ncbi:MAG TPA: UvrD-helicase domain-containing protein [Patescibacteria group bacterium]|nr:UvrD-helicase domain-containing protein [Patescibacteria group bacterium]